MSILVDIIILLLVAIPLITYTKNGFVKSVSKLVIIILTAIIATTLTPYIVSNFDNSSIKNGVRQKVNLDILTYSQNEENVKEDIEDQHSELYNYVTKLGLNIDSLKTSIIQSADDKLDKLCDSLSEYISEKLTYSLFFIIIFVASLLILKLIFFIISKIIKLPVLKHFDKLLGFLLGIISSALLIILFITLLKSLLPVLNSLKPELFPIDFTESTLLYKIIVEYLTIIKK